MSSDDDDADGEERKLSNTEHTESKDKQGNRWEWNGELKQREIWAFHWNSDIGREKT